MRTRERGAERPPRGSSALRDLVAEYKGQMALLATVSFIGALLEALFLVLLTGVAMAMVSGESSVGPYLGRSLSINVALLVAAAVLLMRLALNLSGVRISAGLTADVTKDQQRLLSHAYLTTSWATQAGEPAGRLQELLTSFVARVSNAVSTLTNAITAALSLTAFVVTGLVVDAASTAAVLVALALVGAVLRPLRQRIRRRAGASAQANLEFANAVSELGSLGLEMQTFGVQSRFAARIDDLTDETTATQRRVQIANGALPLIYMSLAYAAVLVGVGVLALVGFDDLAVIGAVILLMLRSLSYGQQLAAAWGSLATTAPFLDQVRETVARYRMYPADAGQAIPAAVTPLEAKGVEFSYGADRAALSGVTVSISQGEVLSVIGPSGAGKSTLAQLLLGLRAPTAGTMSVDGSDLRDVDRSWWSRRVAFVAQDALLITGTVADNIRFFRDDIDDAALRRAALQANVLSDIETLPGGFDTHLGERGSQLSGGQRQRLSIARALGGQPEFLVLDEPTSALDGQSEALIRATLADLRGRITVVIIAHRMSTLDICDRIVVIEHGRMTSCDTPDALRARQRVLPKRADRRRHASFHAVSQSLAARTSQFLRVPGNRIEVIPRGRDPRKYLFRTAGLRESTRSELGIPLDAPTILAVGRMEPAKGQLHLMRGLPVVAAAHPGLVVLVAGKEGASGDDLRSAARGLPADIRFLGHRNDVPALLAAADVLCFPSLREGSPGTLIEAMAVGCPVVASDIPPNYEVLGSGARSAGQLINTQDPQALGDAVNRALANPDFTTHRAQVGRARFEERFTIDAVVTRMADFYLSAAARFSRQPTKP
jgi:ATP-binding cassette subfamily B protein